jgi:hypothetical protein
MNPAFASGTMPHVTGRAFAIGRRAVRLIADREGDPARADIGGTRISQPGRLEVRHHVTIFREAAREQGCLPSVRGGVGPPDRKGAKGHLKGLRRAFEKGERFLNLNIIERDWIAPV